MTSRQDVEEILEIIRQDDALREEVRRHILTEELRKLPTRFTGMEERFTQMSDSVDRNTDSIGDLKGLAVESAVRQDAALVASDMALRWVRTLERHEVISIADIAHPAGRPNDISRDNWRSFRRADVVMEILTPNGVRSYIAVEVSFTADARDTRRAVRNARYLTRFTRMPAYAAIASVRNDREIDRLVTTDEVAPVEPDGDAAIFWSEVPPPSGAD